MLPFSSNIVSRLAKKLGQQTIMLLQVDWVDGATTTYSDTVYPGASPYLVSVGSVSRLDEDTVSNTISVVMDATSDEIDFIFRNTDVHLRPARLYLGFPGESDKALMFEGLINTGVDWNESDRTLKFELISKLENAIVGFSMEDGYFPRLTESDRAKVWPLPFGTVCHYPTQKLTTTVKGFLLEGQGVVDPTLANRICQIEKTVCPNAEYPTATGSTILPDKDCMIRKKTEACQLKAVLSDQQAAAKSYLSVRGGENFPQGVPITIKASEVQYKGVMNGTVFTISQTLHPDRNKIAPCKNVLSEAYGTRYIIGDDDLAKCDDIGQKVGQEYENLSCTYIVADSLGYRTLLCPAGQGGTQQVQQLVGGSKDSWTYYDSMPAGSYIYLQAGTEVFLSEYDDDLVFMASLVPGVVTSVCSYRTFGDVKVLTRLPTSWYTVENVDYGDYQAVEIRLRSLNSVQEEEGWDDEVYVSFVSSVGGNPVDIIEWLIENYTEYSVDAGSFASAHTDLSEFPSNFVLTERPNVMELVSEICRQSRMAYRINNGTVSLIYLAKEPSSVRTITQADILSGTFEFGYTPTEDLKTNHEITWKAQYVAQIQGDEVEKKFVSRINVAKYGSSKLVDEYDTQNIFESIYKASTFWLIRKANTWLEVSFTTSSEHLAVDVLDCITLDIPQFPTTKVVVKEKTYDTESNTIQWKCWTPIRAGESAPYYWAWPATVEAGIYPLPSEVQAVGDGSGKIVIPPVGHPLRVGYSPGESVPSSSGDTFPSDYGYTSPGVICPAPIGNDVTFSQSPFIDTLAKQAFQTSVGQNQNDAVSNGISATVPEPESRPCSSIGFNLNPCGPEQQQIGDQSPNNLPVETDEEGNTTGECRFLVKKWFIIPTLIGVGCGGPCNQETDGYPCAGNFLFQYEIYGSYEAAYAARTAHIAIATEQNCHANKGEYHPWPTSNVTSYDGNPDTCLESGGAAPIYPPFWADGDGLPIDAPEEPS